MTKFLDGAWYAVGWGSDLSRNLLPVQVMMKPIVLFRDSQGIPHALHDRCPHRFAPLSLGVHKGDTIACRYHGLEFSGGGQCTLSPFTPTIPPGSTLRKFPCAERNGILWIWMGDPAAAEESFIPEYAFLDRSIKVISGVTLVDAYYEMLTDNLMDLSHAGFLHQEAFGPNDQTGSQRSLHRDAGDIVMDWFMPGILSAPGFEPVFETAGAKVDVWLTLRWRPAANILLEIGATPPGAPRSEGRAFHLINLLTPESDKRTRYMWAAGRSFEVSDPQVADATLLAVLKHAFDRDDKPMIEACFNRMDQSTDLMAQAPVLLPTDVGALRCRHTLRELIKEEQA